MKAKLLVPILVVVAGIGDKRSYKAVHAVFWSNDKFDERRAGGSPTGGAGN